MEWQFVFLIIFGSLVVLLLTGMPVAVTFILVNLGAVWVLWGGGTGVGQLFLHIRDSIAMWVIIPVVLFVLMGELMFQSGMGTRALDVVDVWMGKVPGRLALVSVGSGALLSSLTGNSLGSIALLMGTLQPEMEKRGYKKSMSLGPIFGASTLAPLIPPSSPIVFYSTLAKIPVGKTLMAGIFPGLVMGAFYIVYIVIRCYFQPSIAPTYIMSRIPLTRKIKLSVVNITPVAIIVFLVIGVIFMGIATPTEASATGTFGMLVLSAIYGTVNWKVIKTTIINTARITGMLLAILLGALVFSQVLAFTGCTRGLLEMIAGFPLPPMGVIIVLLLFLGFLGCFMDAFACMVLVIPIYLPIIRALGFDPTWFVILLIMMMEIGLASPPFGLLVFVMKGMLPPEVKIEEVYKAVAPIIVCALFAVATVLIFPDIALWLPSQMIQR